MKDLADPKLLKDQRLSLQSVISVGEFSSQNSKSRQEALICQSEFEPLTARSPLLDDEDGDNLQIYDEDEAIHSQDNKNQFFLSKKYGSTVDENTEDPGLNSYVKSCSSKGIMPIMQYWSPRKGKAEEINMGNVRMGDQYAEAFAETLPFSNSKSALNMSKNRLSQNGANTIIKKISKSIEKLDLS